MHANYALFFECMHACHYKKIYCVSVYSLLNFDNIELVVKATFSLKCYVSFALALFYLIIWNETKNAKQ